ncbi:Methenyltetrahydrofolate cyclohydrolase [Pelotomaculum sp. FP]|uniref:cyclodeaminase/cyclohydrolase family protein n=1 Tax=Pelotomaculum sp. FP TaxID=261474 RepID=UPI001065B0A8|nr:cyclodeaminase/cyclohydrolase family protein [Pelotomaculum sp. FP]TEB14468.1 Methenyltetrahydrofolate cyclohydrolase [Pelotomaculum sp. FP]
MSGMFDCSFRKVLAAAASDAPTPGGGSVSALVGALGVSMAAMVGNLTYGKSQYAAVATEIKDITGRAYFTMARLEKLMEEDIAAFDNFMAAYRLPKGTTEEKDKREEALQKALRGATETPLEIAVTLLEALAITAQLSRIGNKMAISDAGVAAYVCEAAVHAVLLNVEINLSMVSDAGFASQALEEKERIAGEARRLKEQAVAVVKERMKG